MGKKHYLFGLILSLVFLWLFFRRLDFQEAWSAFRSMHYGYLLPLMVLYVFSLWIRAKRWAVLMKPIQIVPVGELFQATAIGFMANNLFPARIGEVVRAVVLGDRLGISKTASFATIVVERLFDALIVFFLFLASLYALPFPTAPASGFTLPAVKSVGFFSFLLYATVLVLLLLLRFQNRPVHRLLLRFLGLFPERISSFLTRQINAFVSGLAVFQAWKDILVVTAYSLFLWLTLSFTLYLLFLGFRFPLSFWAAVFLEVLLVFGVALPSAPGYVGTFHWVCAAGLILLGMEANPAKSYAMVLWLVSFIPITGLGLFLLWRQGLSLTSLKKNQRPGR